MAIKEVNALSHYTEWTVGHVHSGALGWVAMITMGSLYHMLPRLYGKTEMYSTRLIFVHFWLATIGIVLYVTSMWVAGIMEGLLWRENRRRWQPHLQLHRNPRQKNTSSTSSASSVVPSS